MLKDYTIEFTGLYRVWASSEEEAKEKWADADFGEGEDLDVIEIKENGEVEA